jgi:protein-S-isoprenylcysteine O-methyltransferase Ste14
LFWTNPEVTTDRLLFNILWTGWIYIGTLWEERDLLSEFGNTYAEYQKHVPMFFPWRRPAAIAT